MPQPQPPHLDSASLVAYIDQQAGGFLSAGNSGAAKTLDLGLGSVQQVVLTASAPTITIGNAKLNSASAPLSQRVRLLLKQDATGSRLLPTFVPALNYGVAAAPTLSTGANKVDILDLMSLDGGTTWLCTAVAKGF